MKNFVFWTLAVAIGVILGSGIVNLVANFSPYTIANATSEQTSSLDYTAFVSIMLTAVSIILAALGFVIALLAFIGWNSIGVRVSSLAKTFLKDAMEEGGTLHDLVKAEAKEIIYRGIEPVDTDFEDEPNGEESN
jgi:hypothetical protein